MAIFRSLLMLLSTMWATSSMAELQLALLGQIVIEHDPRDYFTKPLAEFLPMFKSADLVFSNLETAIKGPDDVLQSTRNSIFHHSASPAVLDFLRSLHINALSLANNHAFDFGRHGIVATLREVNHRKFFYAGAGLNEKQSLTPSSFVLNGHRVALLAYATVRLGDEAKACGQHPGINLISDQSQIDWQQAMDAIALAKKNHDVVMFYHHFQSVGTKQWQQEFARAVMDAGADMYISHGEPWLEGIEIYKNKPIFYNLGNFIFHTKTSLGHYKSKTWESVIALLQINKGILKSIKLVPVVLNEGQAGELFLPTRGLPAIARGEQANHILRSVAEHSQHFGAMLKIEDGQGIITVTPSSL